MTAPAFHYELLNEIHANRAARKVVDPHTFTRAELDKISLAVGDGNRLGELDYTRAAQPAHIAATIGRMTALFPHTED